MRSHRAIATLGPLASRQLHVCRLYEPKYRGTRGLRVTRCAECERLVVVTPKVFRRRAADVAKLGAELEIVCDECAGKIGSELDAVILVGPTAEERAEAERINAAEGRA